LIGKGTYGSVYLGLNATTGEMLAVKQVEVSQSISDRDEDRSKTMMDVNSEIETLKDLDHPHIVQYLGYERTDKTISIFLEYVPGGSVGRCLKKHGRFEEKVIRSLIRQTLDGLAYLHAQGRLHRVQSRVVVADC
jgi:mitogen-activated protein kinase kinase kinase